MRVQGTGNPQLMKRLNRSLVLEALRRGPVSRAGLAHDLALSAATVSVIVDELIKEDLVQESGRGKSGGGRKPILLTLKARSRLAIGVDVAVSRIRAALTDLDGNVLNQATVPGDATSPERFIACLSEAILETMPADPRDMRRIIGIGVGCPGLASRGVLHYSSSLDLEDVAVASPLRRKFKAEVVLDNDMNVRALAENQFGSGCGFRNMIYVSIDEGIGAGILIDGNVYRGVAGGSGEFGHMTVDVNGPQCKCGNRGCLGVMAGGRAMRAQAVRLVDQGAKTLLESLCEGDSTRLTLDHLFQAIEAGDRVGAAIFDDAMTYLGAAMANLVNLFAPECIVLGGGLVERAGPKVMAAVKEGVRRRALPVQGDRVQIRTSELGDRAGVVGAAAMVIQRFLGVEIPVEAERIRSTAT